MARRPLEPFYGIVSLDTLCVKIRQDGRVENQAVYVALGIGLDGTFWASGSRPRKARGRIEVLAETRNRGVRDIYLICADGLQEASRSGSNRLPSGADATLRRAHDSRPAWAYVRWPDRDKVIADLKPIYKAGAAEEAGQRRNQFEAKWPQYPAVARLWHEQWERMRPFFALPEEVHRVVSTDAMESLHLRLRKIAKAHDSFPGGEAAFK